MERMTYREAVGEQPSRSPAFSSADFDASDPDEVEVVRLASERHGAERIRELEREVANLRCELAEARSEADDDVEAWDFAPEPWEMSDGLDMPGYGS